MVWEGYGGRVLKDKFHPQARRTLQIGLLLAVAVMMLLIALVVEGVLPGVIFGALAVLGIAVIIFGDLQRRELMRVQDAEDEGEEIEQRPTNRRHSSPARMR